MNNSASVAQSKQKRSLMIWVMVAAYAVVIVVLILLSASNYPVQWRVQVNRERERYLEVIAQALRYYVADHSGDLPPLPSETSVIANTSSCVVYCPALGTALPCYDLTAILVPGYMSEMLRDPLSQSVQQTGFYLSRNERTITIGACMSFFGEDVSVREKL